MWVKQIIIVALFFLFTLLQASFLPYFNILGAVPNLVFIMFFTIAFFENKHSYALGFFTAVVAGFFLDMILPFFFGISILSLIAIYFLAKLAGHFLREGEDKYPMKYFIPMFSVAFVAYYAALYVLSSFAKVQSDFGVVTGISLGYSLVFALIGFFVYKTLFKKD